jgi:hypothetical protein
MSAMADHPAGSASHPSMGPGTEFPRTNARPNYPSRAAEHEAIDALTWEPGREPRTKREHGRDDPGLPLSARKRKELHDSAEQRWNGIKEQGAKLIKESRSRLSTAETSLDESFTARTEGLRLLLARYRDGDYTAEQMEALLADEEDRYFPELRARTIALAELEASALPDDTDPETHYVTTEEERYRRFPAFRSRKRSTEVDW